MTVGRAADARLCLVPGRHDIETHEDCERLVRAFYSKALVDPIIGWLFTDIAHMDLEEHIPKITAFWETILLGAGTYSGGAFAPHVALHLKARLLKGHFERWLGLWRETIDEHFAGERAELAKEHALRVASAFHARLSSIPMPEDAVGAHGGLVVTQH
jgi:hemoglobin